MIAQPVIAYAGMTHLGLCSAAAAAEKGFSVVCYDPDPLRIAALVRGELPVSEPALQETVARQAGRLRFTDAASDLARCDVVYISPDVPTDNAGRSELEPIRALAARVDETLQAGAVMVILSQVPPGFTRALSKAGRLLHYQVETLIFGRGLERALYPERYIIGCADPAQPLPAAFRQFLERFGCPILPMRYESAELAKISINMCLVASVTVSNTLAELCERIGAVWSEIVPALKLDKRIGEHAYLAPGLGLAGGNLERDLATVSSLGDAHGTDVGVVRAWTANSEHRRQWPLRTLWRTVLTEVENPVLAVLGLAYKQDTHSVKNSASLALLAQLRQFAVRVYDPVVHASVVPNERCHAAGSELEACDGADALIVMTPWKQFSRLDPHQAARRLRGRTVLDPYAMLDARACQAAGLAYFTLGASTT